jgi:hypothetical protein
MRADNNGNAVLEMVCVAQPIGGCLGTRVRSCLLALDYRVEFVQTAVGDRMTPRVLVVFYRHQVSELGDEGHWLVVGSTRDDLASKRRFEMLPSCRYPLY